MKKWFSLLGIALFLASCANQKGQDSKVNTAEVGEQSADSTIPYTVAER